MSDFKATLNDKMIERLAPAERGEQYVVNDAELRGFFLKVGVSKKTFMVRGEFWQDGKRTTKKVAIGSAVDISTRDARVLAKTELAKIAKGEFAVKPEPKPAEEAPTDHITLRQAWTRYRLVLERKNRSPGTIANYEDHVEGYLKEWLDKPLKELGDKPALVARRHDELTEASGPYAANGCMRTLRAIYNHARKSVRGLPPDNPVGAVDWNEEERRDVAMGKTDLPNWMTEAGRLRNPIRREFHLFTLLSGSRPTALKMAKRSDLNLRARILHIPTPKGGKKKAFDIELSRQMICCLMRAIRASRILHPEAAETWIFAADGEQGHIVEQKEDRGTLSKWGNDLRHTYRTIGQEVVLSPIDMHLLMNHSLKKDVNTGYITRSKLSDHLRASQQALSDYFIAAGTVPAKDGSKRERVWPLLQSRRIGDDLLDPTPPDKREGVPWSVERRAARAERSGRREPQPS
jgi:integrase